MSAPCSQGLAQVRRGQGVVDHQRDAVLVGDARHALEVEDVALGVAERLGVERLGVGPDGGRARRRGRRGRRRTDLDAQLGQRVVEQVVGAAVERGRGHDVAAVLGQVEEGDVSAACPLATARAATPPSRAAIRSSNTAWVGFMIRV